MNVLGYITYSNYIVDNAQTRLGLPVALYVNNWAHGTVDLHPTNVVIRIT
jgi:hypothetical protein